MSNPMRSNTISVTLVDGTAITKSLKGIMIPATVWASPVAGDTIEVKYSFDGVRYIPWPNGPVTSASAPSLLSDIALSSIGHISFQRTAGTGITSNCGVM